MNRMFSPKKKIELISLINLCVNVIVTLINIILYACTKEINLFLTMFFINITILLLTFIAYKTKLTILLIGSGVAMIVLHSLTNYGTMTFSYAYLIGAILLFIGAVIQTIFQILEKIKPQIKGVPAIIIFLIIALGFSSFYIAELKTGENRRVVQHETWSVPSFIDKKENEKQGEVKELIYKTKAYATDNREVIKKANIYLPYNYSSENKYDILYLMHGTGDNEDYWLKKNHNNKVMLDNLIEGNYIKPLIVVTPTFYLENDCEKDLDQLTYSFKYELRNDLMIAVESTYSTYANSTSSEDFILSREHRAFAGLSRGGVTMYHSVLCESLDYFSYFGAFSGSRTSGKELVNAIQKEEFKDYSINYLYASAGTLDFALPSQIKDYHEQIKMENRLTSENTSFDVVPFKRHSSANWHLNLYNFLQLIF